MNYSVDFETLKKLPLDYWLSNECIPLESDQKANPLIGLSNSKDLVFKGLLQLNFDSPLSFVELTATELDLKLDQLKGQKETHSFLEEIDLKPEDINNLSDLKQVGESAPVIKLVDNLVQHAIYEGATDIHFEPEEKCLSIRYRIDGMLQNSQELPDWIKPALCSRVKILADLDIAEKRIPQDGRIKWKYNTEEMDLRVSSLPTRFGEKIVIRILRRNPFLEKFDTIGFPSHIQERMEYLINRPQGMLFVTGPTGSGKSSTLYAGLRSIADKEINITTIEDPIEYVLDRANQVQINVKAGLTFASSLRSILRQDPDVILLGETRDKETAQISIQAAQTGHLVLSTLHTNDSASAISRLKDLDIAPFMISSSVLGILAQRLVRQVCEDCIEWVDTTPSQKQIIPSLPDKVPHGAGCPSCGSTGYKGRLAAFELLEITEEIRELIINNASDKELREAGAYDTLTQDGVRLVELGKTSVEEVMRVLLF